jgi:hypothetical protein
MEHFEDIQKDQKHADNVRHLIVSMRKTRLNMADRTGIVVDLRDAQLARLEALSEALEPLYAAFSHETDLFERVLRPSKAPKLWVDVVAYVRMAPDHKRLYQLVLDRPSGEKVLAQGLHLDDMVQAVQRYLARRLVQRDFLLRQDPFLETLRKKEDGAPLPMRVKASYRGQPLFAFSLAFGFGAAFAGMCASFLWVIA